MMSGALFWINATSDVHVGEASAYRKQRGALPWIPPNEVVSKSDLLTRIWPDVTVEEVSLRFHIANLRKALGDGKGGARYITPCAVFRGQAIRNKPLRLSRPPFHTPTCPAAWPEWSGATMMFSNCQLDWLPSARERLMAFTLWHPDAVSGSHPPHLLCAAKQTMAG
jgi:hypothetical protein